MSTLVAEKPTRIREVGPFKFDYFLPIREADGLGVDEQRRTARVIIITEGLGNLRDRNFYTKDAVRSATKIFNGKQFYIDHPTQTEEQERPERSVRDLGGFFSDCQIGTVQDPETGEELNASFATLNFADSAPGQLALDQVKTALNYQKKFPDRKDVYAGISINGGGVSHPGTIKGMPVNMVTEISEAFSADIVTKPARGGRFVALVREAARTAEWKRRRAREARARDRAHAGSEGGAMAQGTAVADKKDKKGKAKEAGKKPDFKAQLTKLEESFKKLLKVQEAKTATGEKMAALGEKLKALQDEAAEPGADLGNMIADLQQDIGELSKALGMGGGAAAPGDEEGGEDEGAAYMGEKEGEGEDEEEAEGGEDEEEAEGGEDEGEEEAEGGEDEEEKEALGGEDERDYGMRGDEEEAGAMQYKCASCGEVNRVMPPKGFRLARLGEAQGNEAMILRGAVERYRRMLEAKEGRFVTQNKKTRKLLQENIRLRAENMKWKNLEQAAKLLKEAKIPRDMARPEHLLAFDPEQWPGQITFYKRMLEKETQQLNRVAGAGPRGADGADGKKADDGAEAVKTFKESYKKEN